MITAAPDALDACFIPHHFFRYYDSGGKKVGEVAVCFCCEGLLTSGSKALETEDRAMVGADYPRLKALVAELGEPTDVFCD